MRKFILVVSSIIFINLLIPCHSFLTFAEDDYVLLLNSGMELLKYRKDEAALANFTKILSNSPDNLTALWGKAEVLRRSRDYNQAEIILKEILNKNPKHFPSLVSLANLRYKEERLNDALKLANQVLDTDCPDKDNQALAYVVLGGINSKYASKGGLLSKIKYGMRIKGYFLTAKELAPDLPEIHLALGTFYLLAPKIIGGNIEKAMEELEYTIRVAPDFATANARLAQCYKKKGDLEKYNFYLKRTQELDPQNEVLKELNRLNG